MTTSQERPKEFEGKLAPGKDWREIVAWVGDLPPMPQVASRAISMIENPDTTANELNELLSTDAALAARVLKIANSAMFSRQREITTLTQAIMIIGYKALKGIIVAATLRQINKGTSRIEKLVWQNSMGCACTATVVAKKLKKKYTEEIFLLGLLHSLGQIVLLSQDATLKEYKTVPTLVQKESLNYVEAEQQIFGFAHPLIGALVAKKWNFSAETCQVILHYADAVEGISPESELDEKVAIVQLSDLITHAAKIGSPEGYPEQKEQIALTARYLGFTGPNAEADIAALITESAQQFQNESHIYA